MQTSFYWRSKKLNYQYKKVDGVFVIHLKSN
jgi:hypothetical protein